MIVTSKDIAGSIFQRRRFFLSVATKYCSLRYITRGIVSLDDVVPDELPSAQAQQVEAIREKKTYIERMQSGRFLIHSGIRSIFSISRPSQMRYLVLMVYGHTRMFPTNIRSIT